MTRASEETIVITGAGAVTAAGPGAPLFWDTLFSGQCLIRELPYSWASPPFQLGAPVLETGASSRVPPRRLRRLGRLAQMAVVASWEALEQARLTPSKEMGTIVGTGLGALEETIQLMDQLRGEHPETANPSLFPASVMNVAAAHVSMELGLQGYSTTVNHKEISFELALLLAMDVLRLGRAEVVIVGGVDELSQPVHHGYRRMSALARQRPRPYAGDRAGLVLGEGAGMFVLERSGHALARGAPIMAQLEAVGITGGPRPLVSWGPSGEAGKSLGPAVDAGMAAIALALRESGFATTDIDLVIGSGCGSLELDQLEADVLHSVFAEHPVRVTSLHGGWGTWMASGSVRLLAGLGALARCVVFPTVGARAGQHASLVPTMVREVQPSPLQTLLLCSQATGGGSSALVLSKGMS